MFREHWSETHRGQCFQFVPFLNLNFGEATTAEPNSLAEELFRCRQVNSGRLRGCFPVALHFFRAMAEAQQLHRVLYQLLRR